MQIEYKKEALEMGYIISSELTKEFNNKIIATVRLRDLESGNLSKECPLFISETETQAIINAFMFIKSKSLVEESLKVWGETKIKVGDEQ